MALGTFVDGRYSATYDPTGAVSAADLGIAERGYEMQINYSKELITDTDAYADAVVDAIYRGTNMHLQATMKEYKAATLNAAMPYQSDASGVFSAFAPTGANAFNLGTIGRLDSTIDGILIMTSTTGTPAASSPATLTATHAMFAENVDLRLLFGPTLRKVPLRWRIYPYSDTLIKYFTTT